MVAVAQLVEPRFVVPDVAGSSPVGHPTSVNINFFVNLEQIYKSINYIFSDENLLKEALTHPSLAYEKIDALPDNQRLEFLGDAVLQLVLTNDLCVRCPQLREGLLTKLRSRLVSTKALEEYAIFINLGNYILLGKGEEKSGGRERDSTLSDALEAVAGAIALDTDFSHAVEIVSNWFEPELDTLDTGQSKDPKTRLQELLQGRRWKLPEYSLLSAEGKDHEQCFEVQCRVVELDLVTTGSASSRKRAEQTAATALLEKLESSNDG